MKKTTIHYSNKSVLIVEDFSQYAYSLRGMMMTIGSEHVDLAYNGEGAIQACKEHEYDIILCDYNLGESKDGQQILEELHSFKLMKKSAVFIIVTAENTRDWVMGAVELQPDSYITKPFNIDMLQFRLDKALTKKEIMAPLDNLIRDYKYKKALKKCDQIIKTQPKFRMTCLWRKYICLKYLKQYSKALKLTTEIVYERAIPWAILGIGEVHYLNGELEKSEMAFKEVIIEFPMMLKGYDWLAKVQRELGQTEIAQQTLIKAVRISPKALQRQRTLGQLAEENFDIETMCRAYRQAVKFGRHSAFASPEEYIKLAKSIGMQLKENCKSKVDKNRLIDEAQSVFVKLVQQFEPDPTTKFRTAVAQADFSLVIKNINKKEKYLRAANKHYERIEEMLSAQDSIEVSDSLKFLGKQDFVEMILEEAVEQYFDDPRFMKHVEKLTTNKNLLINAKKADLYNKKATLLFSRKKYSDAINCFIKASEIAPNNVDINLNHAQALLKIFIADKKNKHYLESAEKILNNIPSLAIKDPRNKRHLELIRFSKIIQQSI